MIKVQKQLTPDKRNYINIMCDELFTVSVDRNRRQYTYVAIGKDGNKYLVDSEESHVGSAYFMANEYYLLEEFEFFDFINKAYNDGHITRQERDRYRSGIFTKMEDKPLVFPSDIWVCEKCGFKNTKGNFCGDCGTPKQNKNSEKVKEKNLIVYAERQSVSMGDDCHAPHRCPLEYTKDTLLSEFMSVIADYVPTMRSFIWEIRCDLKTLAFLIFDFRGKWTYELFVEDDKLDSLLDKYLDKNYYEEKEIFCKNRWMHKDKLLFECDENEVVFMYKGIFYVLSSHPYEPCIYIKRHNETVCMLHNAFWVYDLPEIFRNKEKVTGPDGVLYDEEAFLNVLAAAVDSGREEMNFTYAAKLLDK